MTRTIPWFFVVPLLLAGTAARAQDADAVQLAGACQGCHGVGGQGGNGIPAIARQRSRAELIAMMEAFRTNQNPSTVMGRIARGYTDAEITALAAHYARP